MGPTNWTWLCTWNIQNFGSQLGVCLEVLSFPGQTLVVLEYWAHVKFYPCKVWWYSETCLNWTQNKLESCINWTLNKVPMLKIFVNLTCIKHLSIPNTKIGLKEVQFRQVSLYIVCNKEVKHTKEIQGKI